jgi:hypothetical protein
MLNPLRNLREYLRREFSIMRKMQRSWNREFLTMLRYGGWQVRLGLLLPLLVLSGMGALIWWAASQGVVYGLIAIAVVIAFTLLLTYITDRGGVREYFHTLWSVSWGNKLFLLFDLLFHILFWPLVVASLGNVSWKAYQEGDWRLTIWMSAGLLVGMLIRVAVLKGWFKFPKN